MSALPRVFISYARQDGEEFARRLRERLQVEQPEIGIWHDRARMEGGVGWWKQIEQALDTVDFLILVMTPAALVSTVSRKEWRYARQRGVCVYPVKGVPDTELQYDSLPRWMGKAHFFDLQHEWETFTTHLKSPCQKQRVPFMAPDLPTELVNRPALLGELRQHLLDTGHRDPVAVTTALQGAGGLGKTTMAATVCHDDDIIDAYDDGILWVTLGERPDILGALSKLYASLTGERPIFVDVEDAGFHLAERLDEKNCLIVIDDVWDTAHLQPFLRGGKTCTRLITTRNLGIAGGSRRVIVDQMTASEAVDMLAHGLADLQLGTGAFADLADRLDRWPLLLELAGATLRHRMEQGDTVEGAVKYLNAKLVKYGVIGFDQRDPTQRNQAIASTIEVSLQLLSQQERQRLEELAVFPEDTDVPLQVVTTLWAMDDFEVEELVQRFSDLSLLRFDLRVGMFRLHDVIRSYLAKQVEDLERLHGRLVDAWGSPYSLKDPYAWRWLAYHLSEAGRKADLRNLLFDFEWLRCKIEATDVSTLINDFGFLGEDTTVVLIEDALRLAAHVLTVDKTQLGGQLLGRLPLGGPPEIGLLRDRAANWRGSPWLRPMRPALPGAGGPLVLTLKGHAANVRDVVLTTHRRAISASDDGTLRIWDVERGSLKGVLAGHSDCVRRVAVTADARAVVSVSDDHTVRLWDLATGSERLKIEDHFGWLRAVAVTPDGQYAVVGGGDGNLRVWDLRDGRLRTTLRGHRAKVNDIAISEDGRCAVSASDDRSVRLWDLSDGTERQVFRGHTLMVKAVAITPDGQYALSASSDESIRAWGIGRADEHRVITSRAHWITDLSVTPDGSHVISSSEDQTLSVWTLQGGVLERRLTGHSDSVNAVAVTGDGRLAVSAAADGTLRVWDLARTGGGSLERGHSDRIRAIAVTPDSKHAVSTSDDRTVRLWDLNDCSQQAIFEERSQWGIATTPDGRRVVSALDDATISVWDLQTGIEQSRFAGHTDRVRAISVTPDGHFAVSASEDHTVRVWDLEHGKERLAINVWRHWVNALAVTPDGRRLISTSRGTNLKVWDLETGTERSTLSGHAGSVNDVSLTPDGRAAVSASEDHTVKIWDLEQACERHTLSGHSGAVNSVRVTPNGQYVVSASDDHELRIWSLTSAHVVARFTADGPLVVSTITPDGKTIIVGDKIGRLLFLRPEAIVL